MELNELYSQFNEELRLSKNRASRIEFYTTMNYIKKYLQPGDRILGYRCWNRRILESSC
jgi:hypothetical protein